MHGDDVVHCHRSGHAGQNLRAFDFAGCGASPQLIMQIEKADMQR
jgi:hypothetical protein